MIQSIISDSKKQNNSIINEPSHETNTVKHSNSEGIYATFFLDDNEYSIKAEAVREALNISNQTIINMPTNLYHIEGIVNIRGTIIPLVNLRKWFKLKDTSFSPESKMVITKCRNRYLGILFDNINEVIRIPSNNIAKLGAGIQKSNAIVQEVIKAEEGKRLIQIINSDLFLSENDMNELTTQEEIVENQLQLKQKTNKEKIQSIVFNIDNQEFSINLKFVREIIKNHDTEKKKFCDIGNNVNELIVLRGEALPIVDLTKYMFNKSCDINAETLIIILMFNESTFGIMVDSIKRVMTFTKDDIIKMSKIMTTQNKDYISGLIDQNNREVPLLDIENLFNDKILHNINATKDFSDSSISQEINTKITHNADDKTDKIDNRSFITFRVEELFAINIINLKEIINYSSHIITIPGANQVFDGILNLRGQIIPIVNFRRFFERPDYPDIANSKIFIINEQGRNIGIIVDDVVEILKINDCNYMKIPNIVSSKIKGDFEQYVTQVLEPINNQDRKNVVMIFDIKCFLDKIESWTIEEENTTSIIEESNIDIEANNQENIEQDTETKGVN